MKTIETIVCNFDELDDDAKEKARAWYRDGALDYEWWDSVYDHAKEAGEALGITVDNIEFSGFYSYGDGACFIGSYAYRKGWRAALRAISQDPVLEGIGRRLQAAQRLVFYKGEAIITKRGHRYCDETSVSIDCDPDTEAFADAVTDALRDFMRWIYKSLEQEYEYLMSDECVDAGIRANDYTFTADGRRFG